MENTARFPYLRMVSEKLSGKNIFLNLRRLILQPVEKFLDINVIYRYIYMRTAKACLRFVHAIAFR